MARPRILLVDDNAELLTLLARLVESEGWEPLTAPKGRAAIDLIAKGPAAAAIDVLLPDMMGYEVGAALRKQNIPFVFMTGVFKGGRAANEARLQHGAAGYFEKPFAGKKLVDALRDLLPAPLPTREQVVPPAPAPIEDFDVEVAVEAEDPTDAIELTGRVVLTEGGKVSAVLRGETITAAPLGAPGKPPPPAHRPA
ncbi:MAG TPA: response regulator, partial [Anaeromyxobacteraceae bacterium]|nr:response regulator [Anaeromyxobacteraceae bacterium]